VASTIVYTASINEPTSRSAPGTSAPLLMPMPSSRWRIRVAAMPVSRPIGMFTKKIQCQLIACVSTPPASRPIDAPAEATNA